MNMTSERFRRLVSIFDRAGKKLAVLDASSLEVRKAILADLADLPPLSDEYYAPWRIKTTDGQTFEARPTQQFEPTGNKKERRDELLWWGVDYSRPQWAAGHLECFAKAGPHQQYNLDDTGNFPLWVDDRISHIEAQKRLDILDADRARRDAVKEKHWKRQRDHTHEWQQARYWSFNQIMAAKPPTLEDCAAKATVIAQDLGEFSHLPDGRPSADYLEHNLQVLIADLSRATAAEGGTA